MEPSDPKFVRNIATLGLEESPVGWPKSSIIFTRTSQPTNRPADQPNLSLYYILLLADLNYSYSFLGKEEKRKQGKEGRRREERCKKISRKERQTMS